MQLGFKRWGSGEISAHGLRAVRTAARRYWLRGWRAGPSIGSRAAVSRETVATVTRAKDSRWVRQSSCYSSPVFDAAWWSWQGAQRAGQSVGRVPLFHVKRWQSAVARGPPAGRQSSPYLGEGLMLRGSAEPGSQRAEPRVRRRSAVSCETVGFSRYGSTWAVGEQPRPYPRSASNAPRRRRPRIAARGADRRVPYRRLPGTSFRVSLRRSGRLRDLTKPGPMTVRWFLRVSLGDRSWVASHSRWRSPSMQRLERGRSWVRVPL